MKKIKVSKLYYVSLILAAFAIFVSIGGIFFGIIRDMGLYGTVWDYMGQFSNLIKTL